MVKATEISFLVEDRSPEIKFCPKLPNHAGGQILSHLGHSHIPRRDQLLRGLDAVIGLFLRMEISMGFYILWFS